MKHASRVLELGSIAILVALIDAPPSLAQAEAYSGVTASMGLFQENCAVCHGENLEGAPQGTPLRGELRHGDSMADLVSILSEMGFEHVRTYIQSGNAVVHSKRKRTANTAGSVAAAIENRSGFRPEVLLLEASELRDAALRNPFTTEEGRFLHFFFLESTPPKPDLTKLESLRRPTEQFELSGNVAYLLAPEGIARSKLAAAIERSVGTTATARNWNTVRKLLAMSEGRG